MTYVQCWKKNLTPLYVEEKISNFREFLEKILPIQTKSVKSAIPHCPTNVQWSCQPCRGWGKKRIWHLCECHPSTKWLARDRDVVVFKTKVLRLKIEYSPIKTQMERGSSKECSVSVLWTNESFSLWLFFRGIQPCFLHDGSERLACFEPTKAARFLKTLEVHSVLYDQRKVRF